MVFDVGRRLENFQQRTPVHVFADRQSKHRQNRRRDIDQARAIDSFVPLDPWPGHHEDSVMPMPDRRSGRFARYSAGTLRTGFEAMIGTKNDGGLGPGQMEQPLEHHVMKAIGARNDIFVPIEILLLDPIAASAGGSCMKACEK